MWFRHTTARYMVRATRLEDLKALRDRVLRCFEAGGLATGSTMTVEGGASPYAQVEHDPVIAGYFRRNAEALGRVFVGSSIVRRGRPTWVTCHLSCPRSIHS